MNRTDRGTILLVDDDPDFLDQEKTLLELAGYRVAPAKSQAEAETWLSRNRPDAAVVDLMLERADGGFALARRIKAMDVRIPVILVSSVTSETGLSFTGAGERERAWLKADAVLAKPIRFEQIERELARLREHAA